ncbi:ribosomal protein L19 [Xylaria sp. CBS 124048]|nr:ribosomal protein L19 [Xylaria sp. CBS 124048]
MPPRRQTLRNGTWIIPHTGERTRRQFTLRHPPTLDGSSRDGNTPPLAADASLRDKAQSVWHELTITATFLWGWLQSSKGRGTVKCSVAYLLASLGTFWHPAASFLGPQDGKHIVATIVTYFHPARTAGSQIEAVSISIIAMCYAMIIGICSMATSVFFGNIRALEGFAYACILILYIGFGLGFVGWVKQKLNNPLVSVGASIASIGIITIITKEGAVHDAVFSTEKIVQYLKILFMATVISTIVNLSLWPVSARHELRGSMRTASVSLGQMLSMISSGFLSGAEEEFTCKSFKDASGTYISTLAQMNKNARESKYEYYLLGQEQIYRHDKAVLKSMENLAQSVGGLRSAANTQFELLKEVTTGSVSANVATSPDTNVPSHSVKRPSVSSLRSNYRFGRLSSIDEVPDERSDREDEAGTTVRREVPLESPSTPTFAPKTPSEIFELFIALLGPSMKSLVYTMSGMLKQPPFGVPGSPIDLNDQFKHSLGEAVSLFNQSRANALERLYQTIEGARSTSESIQADFEEVAAACGHFSFSLLSFADEMQKYLDALEELKYITEQNKRTWNWLKIWKKISALWRSHRAASDDTERHALMSPVRRMRQSQLPKGMLKVIKNRDLLRWDNAPANGLWNMVVRNASPVISRCFSFLARDDIRFGLKVGLGATLYAMFAFIPGTMEVYRHWRGEWGLLSFMIVCSMTVGASNATGLARFIGTIVGAAFVVLNWLIADGNPVGLAILGWAVSFGAFYITVDRGNAPMGRFILLSYNVASLYAYSLSQNVEDDDDDEGGIHPKIRQIAWHRVVAVSIGIIWGLIICRLIWPLPARKKFKEGLALLYLQMGLIWKRGPLAILLRNDASFASYMKLGEQAAMQRYATQLQTLRVAANNEYELRGPFPFAAYGRIMASTQRVLDAFHAMSLVTQKHGKLSEGEKALLNHTAEERAQLCARICHVFEVLASSIMLEYPLTDAIPTVIAIRDKLLGKIFRFRKEHSGASGKNTSHESDTHDQQQGNGKALSEPTGPEVSKPTPIKQSDHDEDVTLAESDYALLYAYALVTGQVAKELKVVEKELEGLFGRLDQDAMLLV